LSDVALTVEDKMISREGDIAVGENREKQINERGEGRVEMPRNGRLLGCRERQLHKY
jgi:hypothetical protein